MAEQTTSSIKIGWSAPAGRVDKYMTILNQENPVDNGLTPEKIFSGLTAGTKYQITVYCVGANQIESEKVIKEYFTGKLIDINSLIFINSNR